jgi:glyoxylase-like metal-dependent hydrolase (beta-lactamase superfamily II)/rhodanese-related sulfurtransferase/ubiquinone/menaquinone biosynthesis C-methylase UbiE
VIFTQHYLACLSHASYLIGDETTGRAVVVDPRRDVGIYLEEAARRSLRIERVIETHVHADFLSGHLELAARTEAVICFGEGAFAEFPVETLRDGHRLSLGEVTLEIISTPGHTPESLCVVIYEHDGDQSPYGVLTGDTLFVGDVGRPDLLTSGGETSADALARRLYQSLHHKLLRLPDATGVFPAHGAGSSCGKQLSTKTSSTLGEQRHSNYALQPMAEDDFVVAVTEGQPTRPRYFTFDAARNRQLHPLLDQTVPPVLGIHEVLCRHKAGAVLLDGREPVEFATGHLRGAINVGLQGRFAEWAAAVLSPHRDILLVGDPSTAVEAKVRLARVGYDRIVGQLNDPAAHMDGPLLAEASSRLTIEQLLPWIGSESELKLIDVRGPAETAGGMLPGATAIPLAGLTDAFRRLDPAVPVVVYCASGYRSSIAASLLRAAGYNNVSDLLGGYQAWAGAGLPTPPPLTPQASGPQPTVINRDYELRAARPGCGLTPRPRRPEVTACYDRGVDAYDRLWAPVILPAAATLVHRLDIADEHVVLDVGAGTGTVAAAIRTAAPAAVVIALDASPGMLRIARTRRGLCAVRADALDLPVKDASADVVVLAYVLFHLADPATALEEAARVLRPGGRVGTVTWASERGSRAHSLWDEILADSGVPPAPPRRVDSGLDQPNAVEQLLENSGFAPHLIWVHKLHHQWSRISFWELATGSGANRVRLATVDPETRAAILLTMQRELDQLDHEDYYWEGEVICAVAARTSSRERLPQ